MSKAKAQIKNRISFVPTDKLKDMILEIQEKFGYLTMTNVVVEAIIQMHTRAFPAYIQKKAEPMTAEDKIKREEDRKKIREERERQKFLDVANLLEGEIVAGESGGEVCKFYRYADTERYEMEVPLTRLTQDLVDNQYSPSKEKVEELRAKGKTKY